MATFNATFQTSGPLTATFQTGEQMGTGFENTVFVRGGMDGLTPATRTKLGGIKVGEDLEITPDGVLSVTKATEVELDNTHPITSAAVYAEVGNINALLATI